MSTLAVVSTISVGGGPYSVAVDQGDDTVYVTNFSSNFVSVINGRTGTVDDTIGVGRGPWGMAVDQGDDTVYVANYSDGTVSVINGPTGTVDDTITVGNRPLGVAVDQNDDTVYVTNIRGDTVSVINGRSLDDSVTIPVGDGPRGVAVNEADDTVYVTNQGSGTVSVINGRSLDDSVTIPVGSAPGGVAVDQVDDTVYVANSNSTSNTVPVINGRTGVLTDDTIRVGSNPLGVAVDQRDDTVYVTNLLDGTVSVINGRTGTVDDTITVGVRPFDVAVDGSGTNAGLVYVTNQSDFNVSVIARVSASLCSASASDGSTVTVSVAVPQVDYDVDDSTVTSVVFGDDTATGLTAGVGDVWTLTVPAGSGTVPVTVTFNGGLTASAGSFTYGSPPSPCPNPPVLASAPVDVAATAGDASAVVTWQAPVSSGTFPVTHYRAVSSPAGGTCLVTAPALTCDMTGLANGTTYTVAVQALTGAGWGATSSPSNAVTPQRSPQPSITIVPASAPIDVAATAGDSSAVVTWQAPVSSGSFPVTHYRAVSSPMGGTCLVTAPALTCDMTGLANGTTYTVAVQALTGAGWGAASSPSNAVTPQRSPQPSITITGTRGDVRGKPGIVVTGTTSGFDTGAILRPWIRLPGQTSYTQGIARILVDAQGGFTWQRRSGKTIYISIRNQDGTVKSNRLILRTA